MKYIELNNGFKIPMVGLGTVGLNGNEGKELIKDAIKVGYRLIDTARMYNNEICVGEAIKESKIERSELFITTKLNQTSYNYLKAKEDIEDSIHKLQLDYIDLLLIHEPYKCSYDMYEAIKEAYLDGKIKAIGISNFNEKCYLEFIESCGMIPMINQLESHIYFTQEELRKKMLEKKVYMQAWSPLANGKGDLFNEPTLINLSHKYNKTPAQIALRFLIQRHIGVIPKTSNRDRLVENMNIFDFELMEEEMKDLFKLDQNKSVTSWYRNDWF